MYMCMCVHVFVDAYMCAGAYVYGMCMCVHVDVDVGMCAGMCAYAFVETRRQP